MKSAILALCAAALLVAAIPAAHAADNPWSGTWKQNLDKSRLAGDTMTITAKPGGTFHMDAGGIIHYDFACDGKPHTTLGNRAIVCTGSPESGYDFTTTADGHVLAKSHRTFSSDGKTMTVKGTLTHPDGTTSDYEEVYKRQTGTTGLAGKWLDVKDTEQVPSVSTWTVNGDVLKIDTPADKLTIEAKLDGSPGKITGPNIPAGASGSIKATSPHSLHYTNMLNGKVLSEGTWTLSPDGKTITDVNWIPGRESEKSTMIWEKQ